MADYDPAIDSALRLAQVRPIRPMPETYDRHYGTLIDPTTFDPMPYLRAFGAGVADPAGIPSTLMDMALKSDPKGSDPNYLRNVERMRAFADWYRRRMQELRDESPIAGGAGSGLTAGLLTAGTAGPLLGAGSAGEALSIVPHFMGIGSAMGKLSHLWHEPPKQQRPQAAYPPDEAY